MSSKSSAKSKAKRAGLYFSVSRVDKFLRKGNYAPRIGIGASVYLAAAMEYLSAEILELAVEVANSNNKHRIIPRHIVYAIRNDDELNTMLKGTIIAQGGIVPSILPELLPKKTAAKKNNTDSSQN